MHQTKTALLGHSSLGDCPRDPRLMSHSCPPGLTHPIEPLTRPAADLLAMGRGAQGRVIPTGAGHPEAQQGNPGGSRRARPTALPGGRQVQRWHQTSPLARHISKQAFPPTWGRGDPGVSRYSILQYTAFNKMFEKCKEMGKWPICRRNLRGNKTLFEGAQPLD